MIKVAVSGCRGKMGSLVVRTILEQSDMILVAGFDPHSDGKQLFVDGAAVAPLYQDLSEAFEQSAPDCLVDFSLPSAVSDNIRITLQHGIDCIVGTTGLSSEQLKELAASAPSDCTLFVAPNFTLGAVLLMRFAAQAAAYFPDAEIIEFHHNGKADAPSGTAIVTAERMAAARQAAGVASLAPGAASELADYRGARGAQRQGIAIHAVRSDAFMASQEVILGAPGQKLTLHHDSHDRSSYMPGVMLAIRKISELSGLVVGLEALLD